MADYSYDVFALPVSGHYDCGYSYGSPVTEQQQTRPQHESQPPSPDRKRDSRLTRPRHLSFSRPRSPPTVLPNSFIAAQSPASPQFVRLPVLPEPTSEHIDHSPPSLPPKPWTNSTPASPNRFSYAQEYPSDSDLSTLSTRSRQTSTQSVGTADSSLSTCSHDRPIEPDPLPSHSNPQWLSYTQSEAFSGPRPIQPVRLGRREIRDAHTREMIFQLSDETKLKLSRQAVYQVYEPGRSAIIGTIAFSTDSRCEVAAILRGQDIVMKKDGSSAHRWCFKPSSMTKKGAFWYWHKDKLRGDIILSDAKKGGLIIARIQKDILSYERAGLTQDIVNEICITAMTLAEMARRSASYEDAPSLAAAIAVVAMDEAADDRHSDDTVDGSSKPKRKLTLSLR